MMLAKAVRVGLNHAPYKGMAPLTQDLIASQIAASIISIGDAVFHANDPKLRSRAMTGAARSRFLPDALTAREYRFTPTLGALSRSADQR